MGSYKDIRIILSPLIFFAVGFINVSGGMIELIGAYLPAENNFNLTLAATFLTTVAIWLALLKLFFGKAVTLNPKKVTGILLIFLPFVIAFIFGCDATMSFLSMKGHLVSFVSLSALISTFLGIYLML